MQPPRIQSLTVTPGTVVRQHRRVTNRPEKDNAAVDGRLRLADKRRRVVYAGRSGGLG